MYTLKVISRATKSLLHEYWLHIVTRCLVGWALHDLFRLRLLRRPTSIEGVDCTIGCASFVSTYTPPLVRGGKGVLVWSLSSV